MDDDELKIGQLFGLLEDAGWYQISKVVYYRLAKKLSNLNFLNKKNTIYKLWNFFRFLILEISLSQSASNNLLNFPNFTFVSRLFMRIKFLSPLLWKISIWLEITYKLLFWSFDHFMAPLATSISVQSKH